VLVADRKTAKRGARPCRDRRRTREWPPEPERSAWIGHRPVLRCLPALADDPLTGPYRNHFALIGLGLAALSDVCRHGADLFLSIPFTLMRGWGWATRRSRRRSHSRSQGASIDDGPVPGNRRPWGWPVPDPAIFSSLGRRRSSRPPVGHQQKGVRTWRARSVVVVRPNRRHCPRPGGR